MTIDELKKEEEKIKNVILEMGEEKNLTEKELVFDGVVSEEKYLDKNNTKYKIMWLLKEGYEGDLGFKLGWDLIEPEERDKKVKNNKKNPGYIIPTLQGMAYVTYGLLKDKFFEEMPQEITPEMLEVITRIAWVNISKTVGPKSSKKEDLKKKYDFWKEILFEQIKTYLPDILIFGNTFNYFRNDWQKHFSQYKNKWKEIKTCHPSYPFRENAGININEYVKNVINKVKKAK
jgi:hypothetical protein